ncbi:hypothetical protein RIF29_20273 [Crotalaria pallida]|uniref:Uncharacterized protein n=1 Tax=Crotalaria pallida TaxID=3830 RepID=A0AAN9I8I6_CROPI
MVDACPILHLLDKSYTNYIHPEQELKLRVDQLVQVHEDILLLENQIPFQVFKIVCNDEAKLNKCLQNLLKIHGFEIAGKQDMVISMKNTSANEDVSSDQIIVQEEEKDDPIHLLDYLHKALTKSGDASQLRGEIKFKLRSLHLRKYRIESIRELKEADIRVKKHPHNTFFHPGFDIVSGIL